jgi:hypothetical protein
MRSFPGSLACQPFLGPQLVISKSPPLESPQLKEQLGLVVLPGIWADLGYPDDKTTTPLASAHSMTLFELYHRLLETDGYTSFATDDQLRGVVARYHGHSDLTAWALKCLTVDENGIHKDAMLNCFSFTMVYKCCTYPGNCQLNIQVRKYKVNMLASMDTILETQPEHTRNDLARQLLSVGRLPAWRTLGKAADPIIICTGR